MIDLVISFQYILGGCLVIWRILYVLTSFNWTPDAMNTGRYIALGAFDDGRKGEADIPVAFIVAEMSRLDETRVSLLRDDSGCC